MRYRSFVSTGAAPPPSGSGNTQVDRLCVTCLVIAFAALGLASAAGAAVGPAAPAQAGGKALSTAKARHKKCKRGQVRLRIRKRVSCRPAKRVLPRPKAGDPRLLFARSVLGTDWSRVRNRRGRHAQSLPKLIRKLGPRATVLLRKVTNQGIAHLDALGARASAAGIHPALRAAATGCSGIPKGAKKEDSFTSKESDGTQAKVTSTLGSEGAQMVMELSGHGYSIKVDLDFGACEPDTVEAPACPTAGGQLDGQIRYKLRFAVEVRKGNEEAWSQSLDVTRTTRLEGFTDTDAKLDFLDVADVETSNITLGGSVRGFPPISIRTKVVRKTRVDMRTGAYEPDRSDIDVTVNAEGLGGPDKTDAEDSIAEQSRTEADKQFSEIVNKAINGYRDRESKWQQPNTCANLQFSPASDAIKVKRGDSGSFTTTAIASQGGGASELDARLSNQVYATFSPTRASGQQARFGYTVANQVPSNGKIKVTVRATSKAGVAEGTWQQPIKTSHPPPPAYNANVSGTAVYDSNELGAGNSLSANWSGNVVARKSSAGGGYPGSPTTYTLRSGTITYSYTGHGGGCDVAGSGPIDLGAQQDLNGNDVVDVYDGTPRAYQLHIPMTVFATVHGTKSNCDNGSDNGGDFAWNPGAGVPWIAYAPYPGGPVANDWSISGSGSGNSGSGSPDQTWQWSLTPTS